jgi:hypothetical protein
MKSKPKNLTGDLPGPHSGRSNQLNYAPDLTKGVWKVECSRWIQKLSTFHYLLSTLRIVVGGTGIEPATSGL